MNCPKCRRVLQVNASLLGRKVKCPGCGNIVSTGGQTFPDEQKASGPGGTTSRKRQLALGVLGIAVVLAIGLAVCFTQWSARSPEQVIVGQWTLDKEATQEFNPLIATIPGGVSYQFNADKSAAQTVAGLSKKGAWKMTSRQGNNVIIQITTEDQVDVLEITVLGQDRVRIHRPRAKELGDFLLKRASGGELAANPPATATSLDPVLSVQLPDEGFLSVALSPDGKKLLCASEAKVQLWDVPGKKSLFEFDNSGEILGTAFSPNGKACIFFRSQGDGTARTLVDVSTGKASVVFGGYPWFRQDGKLETFNPKLWKLNVGRWHGLGENFKPDHEFTAISPYFHKGTRIATGNAKGQIQVWEVPSGKVVHTLQSATHGSIDALAGTADGTTLAVSVVGRDGIEIWNLASTQLEKMVGDRASRTIFFLPDSKTLAHLSRPQDPSSSGELVALTRVDTGQVRAVLRGFKSGGHSLHSSADGSMLAGGGTDGSAFVWDLNSLR